MRIFLSLWVLMSGLLFSNSQGLANDLTGRGVMEKQKSLQRIETEYGEELMLLVDVKSNTKEKREVRRYAKETKNDFNRYLVVFMAPADIKGTALLTHEHENEDDQWIYMPASKKMQRIAAASKRSYFMGTDFTYEDLEPEDIDKFTYTIVGMETLDHVTPPRECYKIESRPGNSSGKSSGNFSSGNFSSGYSKRLIWVDKTDFMTLKVEFFDKRNRLIKTQKSFEWENITGTVYRPKKTIMNNHRKKHKTLALVKTRKINEPIADQVFTERFILSEKHYE